VDPADEQLPPQTDALRVRRGRMRDWTAAMQEHGQRAAERAQAERGRHSSVDALISRLIVGAAVVNATLWERRA
jgi:hypothetical protein